MVGAFVTHYCGIQGELSIAADGIPVTEFTKKSGPGEGKFPFPVKLEATEIDFYPGTTTPMNFRSHLIIDGEPVSVSMNNVAEIEGWRFYQSGISPDASRLSISYDPWGTGITYVGYALLLTGMAGFFFQRNTLWRALLRQSRKAAMAIALLGVMDANAQPGEGLPAMQRPLAANMGKVYVYWNDRVCPLQTMAKDVTQKLYGSNSYNGFTPEQVLSGWLFYFDTWERDYSVNHNETPTNQKKQKKRNEQLALINWLGTGEAFKVYPYHTAEGHIEWLSLAGKRPSKMSLEQWMFMQTTMPDIKELLLKGRNIDANKTISHLIAGQIKYAGTENLPSTTKVEAERIYNRFANLLPPAIIAFLLGGGCLHLAIRKVRTRKGVSLCINAISAVLAGYIAAILALLWWIGGHLPLSNGPEMMAFMGLFALSGSLACKNRFLKGAFLIVASMTLLVGFMGGQSPRIGMLMPVLASPLLSIHVMLIMISYVLFIFMAILSGIGLATKNEETERSLYRINMLILVPAVFLLAAGIFIGAVWANQSWGRYWGWDPKETCALVMLIIYSVPVHWGNKVLKGFRKPKTLHWYLLCAILSVIFTYFGANYFLSGLHSYA